MVSQIIIIPIPLLCNKDVRLQADKAFVHQAWLFCFWPRQRSRFYVYLNSKSNEMKPRARG